MSRNCGCGGRLVPLSGRVYTDGLVKVQGALARTFRCDKCGVVRTQRIRVAKGQEVSP